MTDTDDADTFGDEVESVPTVVCSRCDRKWTLDYELDELQAGNRALEQFALDHERHTGHLPDDAAPWRVTCRRCPGGEVFLSERPARRWAETHARHTHHSVAVEHTSEDEATVIGPDA